MQDEFILNLTDLRAALVRLVGGKASGLHQLRSVPGIEVPSKAFIVTTRAFKEHLRMLDAEVLIKELERHCRTSIGLSDDWKTRKSEDLQNIAIELQRLILSTDVSDCTRGQIGAFYDNMAAGRQTLRVAVRSSATAEDTETSSFAGQYLTLLNQQGLDQVFQAIRLVWASTYNVNAITYRARIGIAQNEIAMAVLVMEMVDAAFAGTAVTIDPQTGAHYIRLDQTYGLGESVVSGIGVADSWVIDPRNNVVVKRRLGEKSVRVTYDPTTGGNAALANSIAARRRFALDSSKTREIAAKIKRIQDHCLHDRPQVKGLEIEYAINKDGGVVFLQARPETVASTGRLSLVTIDPQKATTLEGIELGGTTGSPGIASGTIRIVHSAAEAAEKVLFGDLIVAPDTTNVWERAIGLASGLITEQGSSSSHTAVVAREQTKPAIVGSTNAMHLLGAYEGRTATMDAIAGKIYLGTVPSSSVIDVTAMATHYGYFDDESLESHYTNAQQQGQAYEEEGRRWLGRRNEVFSVFLQTLYGESFRWIVDELELSPIRGEPVPQGYRILFEDLHRCREELRGKSLEWHEMTYHKRIDTVTHYLTTTHALTLTPSAVERWLKAYIAINGFLDIGFPIHKVLEGMLEEQFRRIDIKEPYLSQARAAMAALFGPTMATESLRSYGQLLLRLQEPSPSGTVLRDAVRTLSDTGNLPEAFAPAGAYAEYYHQLYIHATNYNICNSFSLDFASVVPIRTLARDLLNDCLNGRVIVIPAPQPEEFFPDDAEFQRVARLAVLSAKLR